MRQRNIGSFVILLLCFTVWAANPPNIAHANANVRDGILLVEAYDAGLDQSDNVLTLSGTAVATYGFAGKSGSERQIVYDVRARSSGTFDSGNNRYRLRFQPRKQIGDRRLTRVEYKNLRIANPLLGLSRPVKGVFAEDLTPHLAALESGSK